MFTVHSGGGAQDYSIGERIFQEREWNAFRSAAEQLLNARGFLEAEEILRSFPFEIREGHNFFGDEFVVLYAELPIRRYAEVVEQYTDPMNRYVFSQLATAMNEICPAYVRFIGFDANIENTMPLVEEPMLQVTSQTVEAALADARQLIASRGSTSGVDRAHTAFHAYLQALCENNDIDIPERADVTTLFSRLRENHPSMRQDGARPEDIVRMLRSLATIINSLNPLRNQASLAHPNAELLEKAEADLVLNSIHTLLHYLDVKLQ